MMVCGSFRILAVIVETADRREHKLDPRVRYGLFHIEFHVFLPVMRALPRQQTPSPDRR